jgi:hypothetical protein
VDHTGRASSHTCTHGITSAITPATTKSVRAESAVNGIARRNSTA